MRRRILVIGLLAAVAVGVVVTEVARRSAAKPALRYGKVSLVGDSLNVGVEPYLRDELRGWEIEPDDVVGRSSSAGVEHLRARRALLGRYIVVSLGTNDSAGGVGEFRADVAEALRVVGPSCVVWVTIHRDGDAYETFNNVLRDAASRNRNLRLVEWATMIRSHPDFLAADGIHGSPDGYRARAYAIVAAMRGCPAPAR